MERAAFVEHVDRRRVFDRDDWMCRLCHEPVHREAEVPHPLAPTIDHVVPLARGGTHEMANVQTAHFECNRLKADNLAA